MRDEAFDRRCAELYVKYQLSAQKISERMGVTHHRVMGALKRQNVPMRTSGEARTLDGLQP